MFCQATGIFVEIDSEAPPRCAQNDGCSCEHKDSCGAIRAEASDIRSPEQIRLCCMVVADRRSVVQAMPSPTIRLTLSGENPASSAKRHPRSA